MGRGQLRALRSASPVGANRDAAAGDHHHPMLELTRRTNPSPKRDTLRRRRRRNVRLSLRPWR